jgi:hypothetical protein
METIEDDLWPRALKEAAVRRPPRPLSDKGSSRLTRTIDDEPKLPRTLCMDDVRGTINGK